jgi:AcrR family transcriptional regulator
MNAAPGKAPLRGPSRNDTRGLIVREAARLFALRGFEGASISEIALASGISKPAIYHHFTDKDQIYSFIVVTVLREMSENARDALRNVTDPIERLRVFMAAHAEFFERNRYSYIAAQLGFRGLRAATDRDEAIQLRDAYERILRDLLEEGRQSGVLDFPDVASAGRLVLSALNWMARWYQPDGAQTGRQIAMSYAEILLRGMCSPCAKLPPLTPSTITR